MKTRATAKLKPLPKSQCVIVVKHISFSLMIDSYFSNNENQLPIQLGKRQHRMLL